MAKIVVAKGDQVLQEMDLSKERITIGRRSYNDIVISDLAISGEHAVIATENGDSFLEDLNSTNGTQINGQPMRKHFLRDGDVIELAQYRICYSIPTQERELSIRLDQEAFPNQINETVDNQLATIRVLNGPNQGKIGFLKQPLTTIGIPGKQVAIIARKAGSYRLTHVEGNALLLVNGKKVGYKECLIYSGDRIDLSGMLMEFLLTDRR